MRAFFVGGESVGGRLTITELQRRQPCIQRIAGDQLLMRPHRHQLALVHHGNPVGILHRGQPVGDHQRGAPFHQLRQRLLDQVFALGVQRAGGFVQQQDRCIHQQGPGDGQALALAARKAHAAVAQVVW